MTSSPVGGIYAVEELPFMVTLVHARQITSPVRCELNNSIQLGFNKIYC
jgi:hypothetical protein